MDLIPIVPASIFVGVATIAYFLNRKNSLPVKVFGPRIVGNLERYSVVRNEKDLYYGLSFQGRFRSKKKIGQEDIDRTVRRFFNCYECLSFSIDSASHEPTFIKITPSQLPIVVIRRKDDHTLDEDVATEMNTKMIADGKTLLWKVKFYLADDLDENGDYYFDIMLRYHHAIVDGISSSVLFEKLLECYEHRYDDNQPATIPLGPSVEMMINVRPSIFTLIYAVTRKLLLPEFIQKKLQPNIWLGNNHVKDIVVPVKNSFNQIVIDEDSLHKLHQLCKKEKTTIHALLITISAHALSCVVKNPTHDLNIKIATPVSLRSYFNPPEDRSFVGVFVTSVETSHSVERFDLTKFWDYVRKNKTTIVNSVRPNLQKLGLLDYIPKKEWNDYFTKQLVVQKNGKEISSEISNIGNTPPSTTIYI
eukprot:TRINITY_DN4394_c0_g1_i2.p1 TRINITY_DN4394_c0_g1~~TRINITY_DN4394_c0_g1_i2.p1  ORF type:complete len:419 (-),score=70.85 TRINITY_DN4394_c0_g1_i2:314-1570(-)